MYGKKDTKNRTKILIAVNGSVSFTILLSGTPAIDEAKYKASPYGGVIMLIITFTTMTAPKWTGWIPIEASTGVKSGANRTSCATSESHIPLKRKKILSRKSSIYGVGE
jgi:hypothetical protein